MDSCANSAQLSTPLVTSPPAGKSSNRSSLSSNFNSMNNIGYAFIGTPKGLQTKTGGILENVDIRRYIDLDGNIIKVEPHSELFSIRKVLMDDEVLYFISQYEYAKEIESQRTGTFFGATIALKGVVAPAEAILLVLSELMASLREYIAPSGRFVANLDRIPLKTTKRMQGLQQSLKAKPSNLEQLSGQSLFVHLKGQNDFQDRVNLIHQSLNSKNFEFFSTVYASDNTTILNFVRANKAMRTASIGLSYETKLEKLEKHYQNLLQNVEQESNNLITLSEEKKQLLFDTETLKTKQQQLSSRYKETEKAIVSNLGKLQKLEKSLTVSVKALEQNQQTSQQTYKQSMQSYTADVAHFQEHLAELQATNEGLEAAQKKIQTSVQVLQNQKTKLQAGNQKLMDDFERIRKYLQQAKSSKEELQTANQSLEQQNALLAAQKVQLQADYDQLVQQLSLASKEKETKVEVSILPEVAEAISPIEESLEDFIEVVEVEEINEEEEVLLEIS